MWFVRNNGSTPIATFLISVGIIILSAVYGFQYLGKLQPCQLCLYQRWVWWVSVFLGLVAIFFHGRGLIQDIIVGFAAASILFGSAIAVYHMGIEQYWWKGPEMCSGGGEIATTIEALKKQIMSTPIARCDEVAWTLLGISMAGYNAFLSITIGTSGLALLHYFRKNTKNGG